MTNMEHGIGILALVAIVAAYFALRPFIAYCRRFLHYFIKNAKIVRGWEQQCKNGEITREEADARIKRFLDI
jgi:hypothetical protein